MNSPVVMFSLTQNTAPKVKKTVLKSFVRIASCYRPYYFLCEHCAKYMKVPWKKENRKSKERLFFRERKDYSKMVVLFRKYVSTFLTNGDRKNIFRTEPKICAGCF